MSNQLTFGRIVNGSVTDVCYGPDAPTAVGQAFAAAYIASVGTLAAWSAITAGTLEGATTSDGKTFIPPSVAAAHAPSVDPIVALTAQVQALSTQVAALSAGISASSPAAATAIAAAMPSQVS